MKSFTLLHVKQYSDSTVENIELSTFDSSNAFCETYLDKLVASAEDKFDPILTTAPYKLRKNYFVNTIAKNIYLTKFAFSSNTIWST